MCKHGEAAISNGIVNINSVVARKCVARKWTIITMSCSCFLTPYSAEESSPHKNQGLHVMRDGTASDPI